MTITADTPEAQRSAVGAQAPNAGTAPARIPHLRALDGLRGLAVLLVVCSHFAPGVAPGGFLGVDVFFVLSGFLITSLLVTEWESSGRIQLGQFWVRRARRLLPALLVVLAVVGLHALLRTGPANRHQIGADGLSSLFYVANWRFISTGQSYVLQFVQTAPSPLRHMWSLAIEEQFYLVWPLVVVGVAAVVRRVAPDHPRALRAALAGLCAVVGLASAGWMALSAVRGTDLDRLYYGTDTRAFMILAGAGLGAVVAGRPQLAGRLRPVVIALGSVAAALLVAATLGVEVGDGWLYRGGFPALAVVMLALLLGAGQDGPNPLARLLGTRPLVGLGLISYGVYLWHWPITVWVTEDRLGFGGIGLFVVRSALTLAVSLASYWLLEQPIRRGALRRLGPAQPFVVGLSVAALAAAFVVPIVRYPAIPPTPVGPAPTGDTVAVTAEYASAPRCDAPGPATPLDPGRQVTVQVIGNSLAQEIRPCLGEILERHDARIVTVAPPDFLICRELPDIEAQATDPATRPDAAVIFAFLAYDDRCGEPWHASVDALIDTYLANGTHVFLVPTVGIPDGGATEYRGGVEEEIDYYSERAAQDPQHITVVDAGTYLRDSAGTYLFGMPCVDSAEPGCGADGTVPVRFTDGVHFCVSADFHDVGCLAAEDAAGERRATAAIAAQVLPVLSAELAGPPGT